MSERTAWQSFKDGFNLGRAAASGPKEVARRVIQHPEVQRAIHHASGRDALWQELLDESEGLLTDPPPTTPRELVACIYAAAAGIPRAR
jgi:hypothetical protein